MTKFPCEGEQCLFCSRKTPTGCSFYGANDAGNAIEDDSRDVILNLINSHDGITSNVLMDLTGYTRPRVYRATTLLHRMDLIDRTLEKEGFVFVRK